MHLRTMSFFTAQDHVPVIPSPLNPFAPPRRRRHSPYRGRIPMSPSEKLLRRKAAEAWKSEIIYRQVAAYELRAVEALASDDGEEAEMAGDDDGRYSLEGALDRAEAMQFELQLGSRHATRYKLFAVPKLGFLSPRQLLRCVGFWRVFTPRRVKRMFARERVEVK